MLHCFPVVIIVELTLLPIFSLFERRNSLGSVASLHPRAGITIPISWCALGTTTWVTVNVFNAYAPGSDGDNRVLEFLTEALESVVFATFNNRQLVRGGVYQFASHGVRWYSANSNNHQQTWGVVAGAIMAVSDFMDAYDEFGYAHFQIFDGGNEVGSGSVGPD